MANIERYRYVFEDPDRSVCTDIPVKAARGGPNA
jgi:hypothetical protein